LGNHTEIVLLGHSRDGLAARSFMQGGYENKNSVLSMITTGTCFIQKIYAPSSSLLQGKHLTFSPSPLRLNIFRLFVILQLSVF
jgi:hypothetical protein